MEPVAHEVVVLVKLHTAPTVKGTALHGLSLTGAAGAGEQVMLIVPQSAGVFVHGLPALLLNTRIL